MGHLLELRVAAGGGRRCTIQLRRQQMSGRAEFLRQVLRGLCDLRQIVVAGPARQYPDGAGCRAQRVRQGWKGLSDYRFGLRRWHGPLLRIEIMSLQNTLPVLTGSLLLLIVTSSGIAFAQGSAGG